MFLEPEEVERMTGCRQRAAQIRQLDEWGLPSTLAPDGSVRVLKDDVYKLLGPGIRLTRLYLVKAESNPPFLKIGISDNPTGRIRYLQTGSPHELKLVADVLGSKEKERFFHSKFAHLRTRGEWFRDRAEIYRAFGVKKCAS